jgi:hypothetical protein
MIDAVGTTAFTYSGSGQLLTEDGPFNNDTVTSTYLSRMRATLTLLQSTDVWTNAFGYDGANRLSSVTSPVGTFSYSYTEPSTRLSMLSPPNGALCEQNLRHHVPADQVGSFKGISDVIGGNTKPKGTEKEKNVREALKKKYPGKLLLELPSAAEDLGNVKVTLTVPDNFPCPEGTK